MKNIFSGNAFSLDLDERLAIVTFDLKGASANIISVEVAMELEKVIELVEAGNLDIGAMLFRSAKKNSFIVGADVNSIQGMKDVKELHQGILRGQDLYNRIDDLKIPTIVAIEGPCVGGGMEISLAHKYRLLSDHPKTILGLPEVKLGLLPGWGGTYRLTHLLGLQNSLDMMLTGKNIRPSKAIKTGLVDKVIPHEMFQDASLEFAKNVAKTGKLPTKKPIKKAFMHKILDNNFAGRALVYSQAKKTVMRQTGGHYPAPLKILDLVEDTWGSARNIHLEKERIAFGELWATPASKNLVNLFFMMENSKKDSGTNLSAEQLKALPAIENLGVLGAGVMGGGIAAQAAKSSFPVLMKDLNFKAIELGLDHASKLFRKKLKRRHINKYEYQQIMDRIHGQLDYDAFMDLDFIVEAIVENMDVKKKVFVELENNISDDCIVASNTSGLRLNEMAAAFRKPERFVGLHFFNPVDKMPLVEVIYHESSSPEAIAKVVAFSKKLGKTPVVCKDGTGFVVNRLLFPYLSEAVYVLGEGVSIKEIDSHMKSFGMPMGPFELMDVVGLEIGVKFAETQNEAFGERATVSPLMLKLKKALFDENGKGVRLGQKTGIGFYHWPKDSNKKGDVDIEGINKLIFDGKAPKKKSIKRDALQRRITYSMINEAAIMLSEGIVKEPWQVDLAMIFGTGFPPFRGGLLKYAESEGLDKIVAELEELSKVHGRRIAPSDALKDYASRGSFYSAEKKTVKTTGITNDDEYRVSKTTA